MLKSYLLFEVLYLVTDLLDSLLVLLLLSLAVLEDGFPFPLDKLNLLLHLGHLLEYRPPGPSHLAAGSKGLHQAGLVCSVWS